MRGMSVQPEICGGMTAADGLTWLGRTAAAEAELASNTAASDSRRRMMAVLVSA